ncbi:unnamed protein product [Calypogeia fissa]
MANKKQKYTSGFETKNCVGWTESVEKKHSSKSMKTALREKVKRIKQQNRSSGVEMENGVRHTECVDKKNNNKSVETSNGRNSAETQNYSSSLEIENGIKSKAQTDGSAMQGSGLLLENAPQQPDNGRRCNRTNGKRWQCANMAVEDLPYCEQHLTSGQKQEYYANIKSGKRRFPVFTESLPSQSFSQVFNPDQQHESMEQCFNSTQELSQGEPDFFTQFSELALPKDLGRSTGGISVSRRFPECTTNAIGGAGIEKENTVNLDSSCPLWSQISSSSSQPFSSKLLPATSKENPQVGKKTRNAVVNAGVSSTPKESSSSLHNVQGPPRFSQLVREATQCTTDMPVPIRTPDSETTLRQSGEVYPTMSSGAAVNVQDKRRPALSTAQLREQILVSAFNARIVHDD